MESFESHEAAAVLKAAGLKTVKASAADLDPGNYEIDILVRIRGGIRQGEEYAQAIVQSAKPWRLLCAALNKPNRATIERLIRRAENLPPALEQEIKGFAKDAILELTKKTVKTCKGKLTASLTVEPVRAEVTASVGKKVSVSA